MKILQIVSAFYPAVHFGGPIHSLYGLCNVLAKQGIEVEVLTTDASGPGQKRVRVSAFPMIFPAGYPVYFVRSMFYQDVAPGMLWQMVRLMRRANLVHLTGVYSWPTVPCLLMARWLGKPLVWSPRGALQHWKGGRKHLAKSVWDLLCRVVAPKGFVFHVTSEEEGQESLRRYPGAAVEVIPNGVETPTNVNHVEAPGSVRLLYLGRLDPKKGIENLLEACHRLKGSMGSSWSLTIAGVGNLRYTQTLQAQIKSLTLSDRVQMVGQVTGETKRELFENSDLLVMPSFTESFGMVVAESLAHGVPVIASRGSPWKRVNQMQCGLWVDSTPEALAHAIEQMAQMPLREMGQRG